jgi:hypothetical protein
MPVEDLKRVILVNFKTPGHCWRMYLFLSNSWEGKLQIFEAWFKRIHPKWFSQPIARYVDPLPEDLSTLF